MVLFGLDTNNGQRICGTADLSLLLQTSRLVAEVPRLTNCQNVGDHHGWGPAEAGLNLKPLLRVRPLLNLSGK
jgi:hypothetical protein